MTFSEIQRKFADENLRRVRLAVFDIDCVLRGRYVSLEKFASAAQSGLGFCDVIFGWDIGDVLYDNVAFTGWHTGYPDAVARVDPDTLRRIPWEQGTAFFLLDLHDRDGALLPVAPRHLLQRVAAEAEFRGYAPKFAAEYELCFFQERADTLRAKNFRNLTPLSPGMFGYSVLRASENHELVLDVLDMLAGFDLSLEGFHTGTGPGVYEAAIHADATVAAADKAALFKTAIKEIASRHGLIPTFMAKWNADLPGLSGHLHQSLWDKEQANNLFYCGDGEISSLMRHYVAGLIHNMPELMVMWCPTINSYKRTVPGTWAPVNATWGVDRRTAAVRAVPGKAKSTRVELRLTGADMNPYLAMAASLAAGLDGIERRLEPPEAGPNADQADAAPLPRNLAEAVRLFRQSELARLWFGAAFVEHYAATREWEIRQFEKAVTDWELERYFESI